MAKPDNERGPFGTWLVRQRKARAGKGRDGQMTASEVRRSLMRLGYAIGGSAYAELEAGTRLPTAEQRRHLEEWAGEAGPANHAPAVDSAAIVEAIERQTALVDQCLAELRLLTRPGPSAEDPDVEAHRVATVLKALVRATPEERASGTEASEPQERSEQPRQGAPNGSDAR